MAKIKHLPNKIYLQIIGDAPFIDADDDFIQLRKTGEITWNDERIFKHDVVYERPKGKEEKQLPSFMEIEAGEEDGHLFISEDEMKRVFKIERGTGWIKLCLRT